MSAPASGISSRNAISTKSKSTYLCSRIPNRFNKHPNHAAFENNILLKLRCITEASAVLDPLLARRALPGSCTDQIMLILLNIKNARLSQPTTPQSEYLQPIKLFRKLWCISFGSLANMSRSAVSGFLRSYRDLVPLALRPLISQGLPLSERLSSTWILASKYLMPLL